jgi:hypothetical protein
MMRREIARLLCYGCACSLFFARYAVCAEGQLPNEGCFSWAKIGTVKLHGGSGVGGLHGSFTMTLDTYSGRYVVERDYGVYSEAEGFDGHLRWNRDRSGASHFVDSAPARAITATTIWLYRRGWGHAVGDTVTFEKLPDEKDGDVVEAVWRVVPKNGIPVVVRFERATGLLRQSEVCLWSGRLIRHYSDWRDIGSGVMIPFTERDEYPEDGTVETIKIDSAQVDAHVPAGEIFSRPSKPNDYGIIGGKDSSTVPYEDDGIGRIFVPVFIDGKGPFAFEVDTGGHLIVTAATAEQLHQKPVGNSSATGGGTGVVHEGTIRVREIRIGSAIIRNQPVWVLPLPAWSNDRGVHPPRAGILGLELFERFAVQLNRRAKTMTLTPLEKFSDKARGIALPIVFTEDAPLTCGSFNGVSGNFELDTGDAGPAIIEGYWAKKNGLADSLTHGVLAAGSGIGGDYKIKLSRGDIALGSLKLPHEVVSYAGLMERGSESTRLQAGVVGESSLYRFDMTYDYGHEKVWIDPNTDVPLRPFNRAGLRLRKEKPDALTVQFVMPDSPAAKTGMKEGDRIRSINGRAVSKLSTADAAALFGGPVGTKITLLIVSNNNGPTHRVSFELREVLP